MEENLKQKQSNVVKIALFGPESTGKTTLAKQLATEYNTSWIPEFARDYLQKKWDSNKGICEPNDLLPIAIGQITLENEALSIANQILFCDTNVFLTKVFSDLYYGSCDPLIEKAAKKHTYDLIFLTDSDVPWEKDDLRDRPENREEIATFFEKSLVQYNKPYIKLSGNKEERLNKAKKIIDDFFEARKLGFTSRDFVSIYNRGVSLKTVKFQFDILKNGIPKINLDRPAILHDGIMPMSKEEALYFSNYFDEKKNSLKLKKFVPASGAASRMFKFLSEFVNEYKLGEESINAYINRKNDSSLSVFIVAKEKLPFYKEVLKKTKEALPDYETCDSDVQDYWFIKTMLSASYFDYANKPKGVLPFHKYESHIATAIEEHLNECVYYAVSNSNSYLHFTVSEEHQRSFETIIASVKNKVEQEANVSIQVKFSYQDKATDVIAVDGLGNPFRGENDELLFRPGGHGALIENLNALNSDIVFVKNIDNVIQNHLDVISLYKKALAGILVQFQEQIFNYLKKLQSDAISNDELNEIASYISSKLNISIKEDFYRYTKEYKIGHLVTLLNRPIRVCGMVKNEGEPGGGPFWVTDKKGKTFLQIVESSQIATKDEKQLEIFNKATHFNPVDLVCGIKDFKGQKFDLTKFVDANSGFVVEKNKNGKPYKAFELPGLWNGAMAKWLTIFVEVPLITFNPVKTVNDLLKPAHQHMGL
ncbi:DUF4301 family protein [Flavobacterium aciduliphilum]|uniref:NadR type nicotinamide-nucleotide adenylyltransferase n=1 Tax=Flavobacterium aciduliphilum TaxID=1101402 RepID=A0A328YGQ9_9FLAO|nr:DUF4301 family protein [Flavobacterium aciduliphilum]RAR72484.1 NadR type nicotinamide-nucleotide adenylyltransferase [Flavobacterium aciduliphilum]